MYQWLALVQYNDLKHYIKTDAEQFLKLGGLIKSSASSRQKTGQITDEFSFTPAFTSVFALRRAVPYCLQVAYPYWDVFVCECFDVYFLCMFNRRRIFFGETTVAVILGIPFEAHGYPPIFNHQRLYPDALHAMPYRSVPLPLLFCPSPSNSFVCLPTRCIISSKSSVRCRSRAWRPRQSSQQPA